MATQKLAHYEIIDKLGAGGMGVVFRAVDTKLGRTVAIKVLSNPLQADEFARARLLREIRAGVCRRRPPAQRPVA